MVRTPKLSDGIILSFMFALAFVFGHLPQAVAVSTVDATLKVDKGVGVGFDTLSESLQTLTINLNAPSTWYILWSRPRNDSGTGELVWKPVGGIDTKGQTHTYTITGIVPENGHAVGFYGKLTKDGGPGGTLPDFDAAVADLDIDLPGVADNEEDQDSSGGLVVPIQYDGSTFPDTAPDNCTPLTVHLRADWASLSKGPTPTYLGELKLERGGAGASGIQIYKPDGTKLPAGGVISPSIAAGNKGYSATYKLLTNNSFTGAATINATFTWDSAIASGSSVTAKDNVRLTPIKVDFVRMWDTARPSNRTTRAIVPALRYQEPRGMYEDSERPHGEDRDSPILVIGAQHTDMNEAVVAIKCQFGPSDVGTRVRWKIDVNTGSVSGPTSGDFSQGDTVCVTLIPSSQTMAVHQGSDFVVRVGIDWNGNGLLDEDEIFPLPSRIRVIGKPEYDYCSYQFNYAYRVGMSLLYPNAVKCLEVFLQVGSSYSTSEQVPINFSWSESYDQVRGMGCDPVDFTQGTCRKCTWNTGSTFADDIMYDTGFRTNAIRDVVSAAHDDILNYYTANPNANSHTFTYHKACTYQTEHPDILNSVNMTSIDVVVEIRTIRGTTKPQITSISLGGNLTDLYDFNYDGSDNGNGWASRIQTCYDPTYARTTGYIYKMRVVLDHLADWSGEGDDPLSPVSYDDLDMVTLCWGLTFGG